MTWRSVVAQLVSPHHATMLAPLALIDTVVVAGGYVGAWSPNYHHILVLTTAGYWISVALNVWIDRSSGHASLD